MRFLPSITSPSVYDQHHVNDSQLNEGKLKIQVAEELPEKRFESPEIPNLVGKRDFKREIDRDRREGETVFEVEKNLTLGFYSRGLSCGRFGRYEVGGVRRLAACRLWRLLVDAWTV
ncbi:hypothetical protein L1987_44469 [Smallanthus sonchifolius]|uniref:Uncharacterized protein n=1 Tax=Smallanthus sonchifolius TaxID=185202 RepID=A0ACB9GQQ8_9ASTR|nr:hypothetical protein L1987_44469 [Smallanthus sonchifolius]